MFDYTVIDYTVIGDNPNFSVVTPWGCGKNCLFCSSPSKNKVSDRECLNFIPKMIEAIHNLPSKFKQVSITGGEPTKNADIVALLAALKASNKFEKIVLTTNGNRLLEFAPQISRLVDHVNISRHAADCKENAEIFGGVETIEADTIFKASRILGDNGVDLNMNCVVNMAQSDCLEKTRDMVAFARSAGVNSITMRQEYLNSIVDRDRQADIFSWFNGIKKINVVNNSTVKKYDVIIDGMKVRAKSSPLEPSVETKSIQELIFQPNGSLTADWAGEVPVEIGNGIIYPPVKKIPARRSNRS